MEASNIITPIIDITPTAEGSQLPRFLQEAFDISVTTFDDSNNSSSTIVNTPGFHRIFGVSTVVVPSSGQRANQLRITDGATTKTFYLHGSGDAITSEAITNPFDVVVFIRAGESVTTVADFESRIGGSVRQVADVTGNLVNPSGFNFE